MGAGVMGTSPYDLLPVPLDRGDICVRAVNLRGNLYMVLQCVLDLWCSAVVVGSRNAPAGVVFGSLRSAVVVVVEDHGYEELCCSD